MFYVILLLLSPVLFVVFTLSAVFFCNELSSVSYIAARVRASVSLVSVCHVSTGDILMQTREV